VKTDPDIKKNEIYFILALLAVVIIFLGLSLLKEEPPDASGSAHTVINGMQAGGDGAARIHGLESSSFVLYIACFLVFIAFVISGVSRRYRSSRFWIWIGLITLVFLFVFYNVFRSYLAYLSTGKLNMFLGFPGPTAWMIYGLWAGGALLALFYAVGFRKFIYTAEDEAALQNILEDFSSEREDA